MEDEGGKILWIFIQVVFWIALLIGSASLKYDCCREQGYSHEECMYDIACN